MSSVPAGQTNPNFLGVVLKAEIEKWLKGLVLERKNIFLRGKLRQRLFFEEILAGTKKLGLVCAVAGTRNFSLKQRLALC